MEDVYPGAYSILETEPPPPFYLDTVHVGEAEAATSEVELSSGAVPITLVYKTDGGRVQGTVEQCASGRVVLIPQNTALQRPGFLRVALCDSNDRYDFAAVRPGKYYALGVPGDGSITLNFRKLDGSLFNQASRVTVEAGETTAADLHAITRPPN